MEGPAGVEAHLAEVEGLLELAETVGEQLLLDRLLALVADLQVAADVEEMALRGERERAHLHRDFLARDEIADRRAREAAGLS